MMHNVKGGKKSYSFLHRHKHTHTHYKKVLWPASGFGGLNCFQIKLCGSTVKKGNVHNSELNDGHY